MERIGDLREGRALAGADQRRDGLEDDVALEERDCRGERGADPLDACLHRVARPGLGRDRGGGAEDVIPLGRAGLFRVLPPEARDLEEHRLPAEEEQRRRSERRRSAAARTTRLSVRIRRAGRSRASAAAPRRASPGRRRAKPAESVARMTARATCRSPEPASRSPAIRPPATSTASTTPRCAEVFVVVRGGLGAVAPEEIPQRLRAAVRDVDPAEGAPTTRARASGAGGPSREARKG